MQSSHKSIGVSQTSNGKASELTRRKLNVDQAAAHVGLSVSKMNKLRGTGGGPKYYKLSGLGGGGGRVVYDVVDLDAWVAQFARTSTSQNTAA